MIGGTKARRFDANRRAIRMGVYRHDQVADLRLVRPAIPLGGDGGFVAARRRTNGGHRHLTYDTGLVSRAKLPTIGF